MSNERCLLCEDAVIQSFMLPGEDGGLRTAWRVDCLRCGFYDFTEPGRGSIETCSAAERSRLSAITRAASDRGEILELSGDHVRWLLDNSPTFKPGDKARVTNERQHLGQVVQVVHIGGFGLNNGDVAAKTADGQMGLFGADQLTKVEE